MTRFPFKVLRPAPWVLALFAASGGLPLHADIYRWVDEHGRTVFSQSPPPSGHADKVKPPPPPPPDEVSAAEARQRSEIQRAFDSKEDQKQAAQDKTKKDAAAEQRAKNCATARQNLETLRNLGTRSVRMPNGQLHNLSEQEKTAKIKEAEEQIAQYCK
jgi:hypothetical protein